MVVVSIILNDYWMLSDICSSQKVEQVDYYEINHTEQTLRVQVRCYVSLRVEQKHVYYQTTLNRWSPRRTVSARTTETTICIIFGTGAALFLMMLA